MDRQSEQDQEKKSKRFSFIMSAIVHGSLLLLFLLLVAWRQPDPPNTLSGLTFNLGVQDEGFGDTDSEVDSPTEETENTTPPESETESEETQEEEVTPEEVVEETPPVTEPVEETKPVEKPTEAVVDPVVEETVEATETQETESDVKVEEKKPEEVEKKKEEEVTPPVEPVKEEEKKEEPKKPEPKPDPVVRKEALLGAKKSDTKSNDPASSNQGDKVNTQGQMGKKDGKANTNGQAEDGGNLGVSLSLDGWAWDRAPSGKDASETDGVIIFQIKVDDRGVVREVTKMPGTTISDNTVVEFYKKEVQKLSFKRTLSAQAAPISVGEIKFIIKTK